MADKKQILALMKNMFVPSFCYEFDIGIVDLHYSERLGNKLDALGAHIVKKESNEYKFIINTSRLLKRYRMGKALITIRHIENSKFYVSIEFQTQKYVFFAVATIVSIVSLISVFTENKDVLLKILAIPLIFPFGHLYFWGSLAANMQRIKKFFITLGN
jgi:hypothetical protein